MDASLKHDVSVPVSCVPRLIEEGSALVHRLVPEGDVVGYGHSGDGNLHFNVSQRPGADEAAFVRRGSRARTRRCSIWSSSLGGSISAEHGIGRLQDVPNSRSAPIRWSWP